MGYKNDITSLTDEYKNNYEEIKKNSPFDQVMSKTEPKFLASVRKWEKRMGFVTPLLWTAIINILLLHSATILWSAYYISKGMLPKWYTVAFLIFTAIVAGFGVTGGAHRYWTHRSYKAKKPLQLILLFCFSVAGENTVFEWVRDHRVHHKHSDTSADPHDVSRGFWFSHMGWLMMKKHPDVLRAANNIDMNDILQDPLLSFHTKYYVPITVLCGFVLPTLVPVMCWSESWDYAIFTQAMFRYVYTLHCTWAVNSFAHIWGNKPYNKDLKPAENWGVSLVALGEGWHNYHHTFPWDYKAAELAYTLNPTTLTTVVAQWLIDWLLGPGVPGSSPGRGGCLCDEHGHLYPSHGCLYV